MAGSKRSPLMRDQWRGQEEYSAPPRDRAADRRPNLSSSLGRIEHSAPGLKIKGRAVDDQTAPAPRDTTFKRDRESTRLSRTEAITQRDRSPPRKVRAWDKSRRLRDTSDERRNIRLADRSAAGGLKGRRRTRSTSPTGGVFDLREDRRRPASPYSGRTDRGNRPISRRHERQLSPPRSSRGDRYSSASHPGDSDKDATSSYRPQPRSRHRPKKRKSPFSPPQADRRRPKQEKSRSPDHKRLRRERSRDTEMQYSRTASSPRPLPLPADGYPLHGLKAIDVHGSNRPMRPPHLDTHQQFSTSPHWTPTSSRHGSPHSASPYNQSRAGWGSQQQQSHGQHGMNAYSPSYCQHSYPPQPSPQAHYYPNGQPSPYASPPQAQPNYQAQSFRGGPSGIRGDTHSHTTDRRYSGPCSDPTHGHAPNRGPSGHYQNLQWTAKNSSRRKAYDQGPAGQMQSPCSHTQPQEEEDDNPFRPSKDLQVEDQMEKEPKPNDTAAPSPKESSKFSFAFKAKAAPPAPTKPLPDLTQKVKGSPRKENFWDSKLPRREGRTDGKDGRENHDADHSRDDRNDSDSRYKGDLKPLPDLTQKMKGSPRTENFSDSKLPRREERTDGKDGRENHDADHSRDDWNDIDSRHNRDSKPPPDLTQNMKESPRTENFSDSKLPRREERTDEQDRQENHNTERSRDDRNDSDSRRNGDSEQESGRERSPDVRMEKRTMKRMRPKRTLSPSMADSISVYYRKPGNESVVGSGTYGKVFKAIHVYTKNLTALKKIRMDGEKDGFPVTAIREIKILQSLKHENVVSLQEVMVELNECFMVFEYLSHDLTGLLHHPTFKLEQAHKKHLGRQLFEGLNYLHRRGVLHRDIKAANILVSSHGQLKIADFGLARFYAKRGKADYTNRVITIWYRAPELLLGETQYGPAVDIWSAACVMIEVFTKHAIFPGDGGEINQLDKIYNVLGTPMKSDWPGLVDVAWFELLQPTVRKLNRFAEKYQDRLTPAAFDLLSAMFLYDPNKRPTASDVLEHPYFTVEKPHPRRAIELKDLQGDWHEFESKALRKENERKNQEARRAARAIEQKREKAKRRAGASTVERESKRIRAGSSP
ncbi:MAG: hypothetical protein Q9163_002778 [Psora crenata]